MLFTVKRQIVALVTCGMSFSTYQSIPYEPGLLKAGFPRNAQLMRGRRGWGNREEYVVTDVL